MAKHRQDADLWRSWDGASVDGRCTGLDVQLNTTEANLRLPTRVGSASSPFAVVSNPGERRDTVGVDWPTFGIAGVGWSRPPGHSSTGTGQQYSAFLVSNRVRGTSPWPSGTRSQSSRRELGSG